MYVSRTPFLTLDWNCHSSDTGGCWLQADRTQVSISRTCPPSRSPLGDRSYKMTLLWSSRSGFLTGDFTAPKRLVGAAKDCVGKQLSSHSRSAFTPSCRPPSPTGVPKHTHPHGLWSPGTSTCHGTPSSSFHSLLLGSSAFLVLAPAELPSCLLSSAMFW